MNQPIPGVTIFGLNGMQLRFHDTDPTENRIRITIRGEHGHLQATWAGHQTAAVAAATEIVRRAAIIQDPPRKQAG